MHDAYNASLVWYGNGDIKGDNYKCQQEASSGSSGATGYIHMPLGANVISMPMDSGGGRQINQQLYHSCMSARGYTLHDGYELDRWREKQANASVRAPLGSLCGPSNVTIGARLRKPDGKMVRVTALYANSPRCSDPATPTPVDVEEVGEGESSIGASQGSHCAASNATIGTRLKIPGGKMVKVKTLYGNSPRCSDPAISILVDVEDVGEEESSVRAPQSEQDSTAALTNLGLQYYNGRGVPQDYVQARQWYEKAAAQGNANAQFMLGLIYANGQGVPQDYAMAREWYEQAAVQGNANAQNNLGALYFNGRGVLGMLFHFGQGMPQDYAKARQWYEKAAAQGHGQAQSNLGLQYQHGRGVPQNYVRAYMWYNLAAPQLIGEMQKFAENNRDKVARRMTPAQIAEAQQLAQQCQTQQFKGC